MLKLKQNWNSLLFKNAFICSFVMYMDYTIRNMFEIFELIVKLHNNREIVCKGKLDMPNTVNRTVSNNARKVTKKVNEGGGGKLRV